MIFSNYNKIATSSAKKKVLQLANKAICCIQPKYFIPQAIKLRGEELIIKGEKISLAGKRIFVIGAGKASAEMAYEIEKILGAKRITAGLVITNKSKVKMSKIKIHLADHPIPSARGLKGSKKIFALKDKYNINENDLIIALVSGGGSALLPHPVSGVTLKDKKTLYNQFIKCGVPGFASTIVKTKISNIKGGGLARHFYPTPIISLVLSDDNGKSGDEFTSSGPFIEHHSTFADALKVIDKYKMRTATPRSIISYLEAGMKQEKLWVLDNVKQYVLAKNMTLISELKNLGKKAGFIVKSKNNVSGETQDVAREFCAEITKQNFKRPSLLVYGGETTVSLPAQHGMGGRNQEFVLTCLKYLDKNIPSHWALASIATDGVDYITKSAGGIIGNDALNIMKKKDVSLNKYLVRHNSYNLLKLINANIFVGKSTGTNVGDLMIYLQL